MYGSEQGGKMPPGIGMGLRSPACTRLLALLLLQLIPHCDATDAVTHYSNAERVAVCLVGSLEAIELTWPSISHSVLKELRQPHLFVSSVHDVFSHKVQLLRNYRGLQGMQMYEDPDLFGDEDKVYNRAFRKMLVGCIDLITAAEKTKGQRYNSVIHLSSYSFWKSPFPPLSSFPTRAYVSPPSATSEAVNVGAGLCNRSAAESVFRAEHAAAMGEELQRMVEKAKEMEGGKATTAELGSTVDPFTGEDTGESGGRKILSSERQKGDEEEEEMESEQRAEGMGRWSTAGLPGGAGAGRELLCYRPSNKLSLVGNNQGVESHVARALKSRSLLSSDEEGGMGTTPEQFILRTIHWLGVPLVVSNFSFCVLASRMEDAFRRQNYLPLLSLSTQGILNGALCRPCVPSETGSHVLDILDSLEESARPSLVLTKEQTASAGLCMGEERWEPEWEAIFDSIAGKKAARLRKSPLLASSQAKCEVQVGRMVSKMMINLQPSYLGPDPSVLCLKLGPLQFVGRHRWPVFATALSPHRAMYSAIDRWVEGEEEDREGEGEEEEKEPSFDEWLMQIRRSGRGHVGEPPKDEPWEKEITRLTEVSATVFVRGRVKEKSAGESPSGSSTPQRVSEDEGANAGDTPQASVQVDGSVDRGTRTSTHPSPSIEGPFGSLWFNSIEFYSSPKLEPSDSPWTTQPVGSEVLGPLRKELVKAMMLTAQQQCVHLLRLDVADALPLVTGLLKGPKPLHVCQLSVRFDQASAGKAVQNVSSLGMHFVNCALAELNQGASQLCLFVSLHDCLDLCK